jgi:hypothetical protein
MDPHVERPFSRMILANASATATLRWRPPVHPTANVK